MKAIIAVCAAVLLGLAVYSQAQPGAGGGRGGPRGGGGGGGVEASWALICFELKVSGEQLAKLMPVYQEAWEKRKALVKQMQESDGDRQEMGQKMQQLQDELATKYSAILKKEQVDQLNALLAERQQGWRGGGGGGGRGQGQ